jgi:arsenite methyltransferase
MTDEQLETARKHIHEYSASLGYSSPNMQFVKGYIENLAEAGIKDESVDMIISNCVVNLSPDKASVIREAYRVLATGGEFYFSDVYCDRRLSKAAQENEVCLSPIACLQLFTRICVELFIIMHGSR